MRKNLTNSSKSIICMGDFIFARTQSLTNKFKMNYKQLLTKILLKKAKGYTVHEKTEEFVAVNGQVQLSKRKITTKKVPPDVNAIKALLQLSDEEMDVCKMTDEQLAVEKLRLLKLLDICDNTTPMDTSQQE